MGDEACFEVAGDHAPRQGRDGPPTGHGVPRRSRVSARAAVPCAVHRRHRRRRAGVLRQAGAGVERALTPVAMLCRISERAPHATRALAEAFGDQPRFIGSEQEAITRSWDEDLREGRGCLLEAGGQVDDALADGRFPLLFAADCAIALTTLAAVRRHRPDTRVLWLDAHGDFNTPDRTQSGFLGGMALAGAVGEWNAGLGVEPFPAERVVLAGVRDLHPPQPEAAEGS